MKITTKQVRATQTALQELVNTKLPAATAMRVGLVVRALRDPMQVYGERFDALLKEHGTPKEGTDQYTIAAGAAMEAFTKEVESLNTVEIEIPVEPIGVEAFGNAEISPATLVALDWLIKI